MAMLMPMVSKNEFPELARASRGAVKQTSNPKTGKIVASPGVLLNGRTRLCSFNNHTPNESGLTRQE
jgi:hypothetical protein